MAKNAEKSKSEAPPAPPVTVRKELTVNDKTFDLLSQVSTARAAAQQQENLVLAAVLAVGNVDNVRVLGVETRGRRKVLVYELLPEPEAASKNGKAKAATKKAKGQGG